MHNIGSRYLLVIWINFYNINLSGIWMNLINSNPLTCVVMVDINNNQNPSNDQLTFLILTL